jgi:uracil-DNA glycosylase
MNEAIIRKYQQRCFWHYSKDVGLPCPYTYPDGNPIRPLPPLQTACGGLMIVGAYPSARFEARPSAQGTKRLVPIGDNLHPFAEELYFDGVQSRRLESGHQVRRHLLEPLGVSHDACWITDLVKVFLYKPSHRDSVGAVHPDFNVPVMRGRFAELAERSLPWLKQECELCQPSLVVTLGEEVAQVVSQEPKAKADDLLNRDIGPVPSLDDWPVLHLPHPDACRRSEKWATTMVRRVKTAATWLAR